MRHRIALCLIPSDTARPEHRWQPAQGILSESFPDTQEIIYLDCDQPECGNRIKENYPHRTLVARTSKARYQVYWRLDHPVTIAEQEQLISAMAIDVHADRAATDVSRVLRLPSFWNRKRNRDNTQTDFVISTLCN